MTIFNLPDLGEGLPNAEIHEWFVTVGETRGCDQPLVAMETAKAVVEVPSPQSGIIEALYGTPGTMIQTGAPLVRFKTEHATKHSTTVVGELAETITQAPDEFIIGAPKTRPKATPRIRKLARQWGINLEHVTGTGEHGLITENDLTSAHHLQQTPPEGFESLKGVRKHMLISMLQSHQSVVPVSIFDEADITAWIHHGDITIKLIQAICHAAQKEPTLNAWFNEQHSAIKCFDTVHLGIAMDHPSGLFVPVIAHAETFSEKALRAHINDYKHKAETRAFTPQELQTPTFTLSNFGKFAGRFANPIVVPPSVAILGVGRYFPEVSLTTDGVCEVRQKLPLSLSFDHRAVTGGEATRFLKALIDHLQQT